MADRFLIITASGQYKAPTLTAVASLKVEPAKGSGVIIGGVTTTAATEVAVRSTAYVEQAAGGQRSFSSSSASDAAAGTGVRTIRLTFYKLSGVTLTGPFTEDITLNGVTAVNTVATDICKVEKIEALTVGTGLVAAGVITMFAATAAGGGAIASIAAGQRRTGYAHHYVPTGITCRIASVSAQSTATTGNVPTFAARSLPLDLTNAAEVVLLDGFGVQGSTGAKALTYPVARAVVGPARIVFYVTPSNVTNQQQQLDASYVED